MPTAQNTVELVTHYRIPENFNPHDSRQKFQPLTDEFPTMFVISPGQRILSAEISPPHTSIDAMHHLNFARRQHIPPICPCHLLANKKRQSSPATGNRPYSANATQRSSTLQPAAGPKISSQFAHAMIPAIHMSEQVLSGHVFERWLLYSWTSIDPRQKGAVLLVMSNNDS